MFIRSHSGRVAAVVAAVALAAHVLCPGAAAVAADASDGPAGRASHALTLNQAIRLTREGHLGLRAAARSAEAAGTRARAATRRPNPSLSAGLENVGGSLDGRAETSLLLEQPLELGGDRGARAGVGGAATALATAQRDELALALEAETVERFCAAWVVQERVRQLREAERMAGVAVEAAGERLRAGAAPAFERTRAESFRALREIERQRAEAELSIARRRLAIQWSEEGAAFDSLSLPEPSPQPPPPMDELLSRLASHPRLRRARAERDAEQWRVREARAARIPDLQIGAGVRHLSEADGTGFIVGLSMPLPLWNTGRDATLAYGSELEAATGRERQVAIEIRAEFLDAGERFAAALAAWSGVRERVHPAAVEAMEMIRNGYRSGRLGYLDIQEGQRTLLEAELLRIDTTAEVWRTWKTLERLGATPTESPAPGKEER